MSEAKHTPGPWKSRRLLNDSPQGRLANVLGADGKIICTFVGQSLYRIRSIEEIDANARLIVAATDLLKAAQLQEAAEDANANCEECNGEGVPELCEKCFPLFDDARLERRAAISKAQGLP